MLFAAAAELRKTDDKADIILKIADHGFDPLLANAAVRIGSENNVAVRPGDGSLDGEFFRAELFRNGAHIQKFDLWIFCGE